MSTYHILFRKNTQRNVSDEKTETQLSIMAARAYTRMNATGFSLLDTKFSKTGDVGSYAFEASFVLKFSGVGEADHHVKLIATDMETAGSTYSWQFDKFFKDEGSEKTMGAPTAVVHAALDDSEVSLGDAAPYFSNLYERNAQISVVLSAVEAAKSSKFNHRFHSVLFGQPGCGKTAITQGIANMVGDSSVLRFDGSSCTKAGLENFFLDSEDDISGPKIMIFEEIEKADPDIHKTLLSILDSRGEIRKTTGDDGQRQVDVKVLCLATVNNIALFEKAQAGSLASRFTHKVFCPKPSRKCLESILEREVEANGGSKEWIAPTLDYTIGVEGSHDPRRAIAVCMSGRNRLLNGSYQKALRSINPPR